MKTHAEVHSEIRRILSGTTLRSFQVTTNSWEHPDGTVAVEWVTCIGGGEPVIYMNARDPDLLIYRVREAVEKRRAEFTATGLESLHGAAPAVTT